MTFASDFENLTGNRPFPWQQVLYQRFIGSVQGGIPASCNLPTGLGKTSVVAVWLLALAEKPESVPRRLAYVVNRRTVVDQTSDEVEKYRNALISKPSLKDVRDRLGTLCAIPFGDARTSSPLALSTLRGQYADNREWSADPTRPAVIVGTVDMIGSRLLFSGYGVGFKSKPLHAGFLGQDVLLVHDEAHLEPAFQELIVSIEDQQRDLEAVTPWPKLRVMELSATSRGIGEVFSLTDEDHANSEVLKRIESKKLLALHMLEDEKKLAETITRLAKGDHTPDRAVLVFVRKVDDVEKIVNLLPKGTAQQLTGTLRGLERDRMADPRSEDGCPIFARFLKPPKRDAAESDQWKVKPQSGAVYLVCTSAGEVGVNISADHMVCDLSTFESMAQRFGRVNRFGERDDTQIHVVHPEEFDEEDKFDRRRSRTLTLLHNLNGDGSPKALGGLDLTERLSAFAPKPTTLSTSSILFDAWALTTIRDRLPGRPPVEPYLHGISDWQPPETHVAWREEVEVITGDLLKQYTADDLQDLLEDYPLKPHELLRDNSSRVFDRLKKLKAKPECPVWLVAKDGAVKVTTLKDITDAGKDQLSFMTVVLPPSAGGLAGGLLNPASALASDVADEFYDDRQRQRRIRLRGNDSRLNEVSKTMRLIRTIDLTASLDETEEDSCERRLWYWYELVSGGDGDGSKASKLPVAWQDHTDDVTTNATQIVEGLSLPNELKDAIVVAAKFHDLGKRRVLWQRSIGNPDPNDPKKWLAKSGGTMKPREFGDMYRHEFGSLVDVLDPRQPHFEEFLALSLDMRDVVLHLIAVHHGYGRPHFPSEVSFDPEPKGLNIEALASEVPQRFARLQRKYGRWGLAYLESLLRASDYAASVNPSRFMEDVR